MSWDPTTYLRFDAHRSRPFHDLLARIDEEAPRRVVDLGCGPGHLSGLLSRRWPGAQIDALDSSAEVVADAVGRSVPARLLDVREWRPGDADDVVVANAMLQWVPEHPRLLARWIGELPAGGWFAMQVPGNFSSPSHVTIRELLDEPAWRGRVRVRDELASLPAQGYAELLAASGAWVDAWETTYLHRLTGADPVLDWVSGTALRPVRDALDDTEWERFRAELAPRLRAAYPARKDGTTWFPFRRIFAVAKTEG
jgi:trans-aconitate 2-methyltransferase